MVAARLATGQSNFEDDGWVDDVVVGDDVRSLCYPGLFEQTKDSSRRLLHFWGLDLRIFKVGRCENRPSRPLVRRPIVRMVLVPE